MNRDRRHKSRKVTEKVFEIDIQVPGFAAATRRPSDRVRCSAETRDAKTLEERRRMMHDLGRRFLYDILNARLEGKFTTTELAYAYRQGGVQLMALLDTSRAQLLQPLCDEWAKESTARAIHKSVQQVESFIDFCGGRNSATIADLTTDRVSKWRAQLVDGRSGHSGRSVTSESAEAVTARRRCAAKKLQDDRAPRPMSNSTKNRYRAGLSAFCTYLVNVAKVLTAHPITGGQLEAFSEPEGRLPEVSPHEWRNYVKAMAADPTASEEWVLVANILRHTGADVGEVLGFEDATGTRIPGMLVRDLQRRSTLTRIRFKRPKVTKSPQRLVPCADRYADQITAVIRKHGLQPSDEAFRMVDRTAFEGVHGRAAKAMGQPDLRLKDLRHLAAISWRREGATLERVKEWLGHSSIRLTLIYTKFGPDDEGDGAVAARAAASNGDADVEVGSNRDSTDG